MKTLAFAGIALALAPLFSPSSGAVGSWDDSETSPLNCYTTDVILTMCTQTSASVHLDCHWATPTKGECTGYGDISYLIVVPPGIGGSYQWDYHAISAYCKVPYTVTTCPGPGVPYVHDDPAPYGSAETHVWGASLSSQTFTGSRHFVFPTLSMTETHVGDALERWVGTGTTIEGHDDLGAAWSYASASADQFDLCLY